MTVCKNVMAGLVPAIHDVATRIAQAS